MSNTDPNQIRMWTYVLSKGKKPCRIQDTRGTIRAIIILS